MGINKRFINTCISTVVSFSLIMGPIVALEEDSNSQVVEIDVTSEEQESANIYYEEKTTENIAYGLTYEKLTRFTDDGFVDIHVLKMDLENEYIDIDILRSIEGFAKKDTLSDFAESNDDAVAGVNASFFNTIENPSDIIGPEYNDGFVTIQNEYNKYGTGAASLIQTDDNLFLDFFTSEIYLANSEKKQLYIYGINKIFDNDKPVIFNRLGISHTDELKGLDSMYKIAIEEDEVVEIAEPGEGLAVPKDGFVIVFSEEYSGLEDALANFPIGETVEMKVFTNFDEENLSLILSGGAKILEDGVLVDSNYVTAKNARHPRTAVGITEGEDYLIAMVVDGRGDSIGATHEELGDYLLEYDVYNAIHFDGGGSSAMVAREIGGDEIGVKNTPSDGSERRIVNGLGFESNAPEGDIDQIFVDVDTNRVSVNMPITLDIRAQDEFYNPYEVDMTDIIYEIRGIEGHFEGNVFIPTEAGSGTITCLYRGYIDTVSITAVDSYIDLDLAQRVLQVDYLEEAAFTVYATDGDGYKSLVNNSNIEYELLNPDIGKFEDGVFKASDIGGISKVILSANGRELSAYIVVGYDYVTLSNFDDAVVETLVYPSEVMGNVSLIEKGQEANANQSSEEDSKSEEDKVEEDNVSVEESNTSVTDKQVRIDYSFKPSEATQAVYAVFDKDYMRIENEIDNLFLTATSDGQDVMLRGKIVDANETSYNITFADHADFEGEMQLEAEIPEGIAYPIYIERIYVARLQSEEYMTGSITLDLIENPTNYNTDQLRFDYEEIVADELIVDYVEESDFHISIFGATAGRNRLLDEVVLQKVYETMNEADLAIYTGATDINPGYLETDTEVWSDEYRVVDYDDLRIIYLATSEDSIVKSDPEQWEKLIEDINDTVQNNIILIGDSSPINPDGFELEREGELLHSLLKEYQQKSDKSIFYINADGYDYNVNFYEGIRYIDINGLWYTLSDDRMVYLNDTFKVLDFYIIDGQLKYQVNNLYPKVEF